MAELDKTQWPRWLYHASLEAVMVASPEEAAQLPEGYREQPYTEEEREAARQPASPPVAQPAIESGPAQRKR